MARGIDIPLVDYVISYDMPGYTKTYIHRIGRTGRAGREGKAVSLVLQDQVNALINTLLQLQYEYEAIQLREYFFEFYILVTFNKLIAKFYSPVQIGMFKKTMKESGKSNIEKLSVKNSDLKAFEEKFKEALAELKIHIEVKE